MPRTAFDDLPASARVWIFQAKRPLDDDERGDLLASVDDFLDDWTAHGTPLVGARRWLHDRFLVVGVDEERAPPSGCSIDALVRVLKEKERELDVELLDRAPVWFRDGERIRCVDRGEFRELAEDGRVGPDTVVFDGSVTRMSEFRDGGWEAPARERWHGRAFFEQTTAG